MSTSSKSQMAISVQCGIRKKSFSRNKFKKYIWFYVLSLPGMIYFLLFHYIPLWGVLISFQDYSPFLGFFKSEWIGFGNFQRFFGSGDFLFLLRNTLVLSFSNIIVYFPIVIMLAILLNELKWGLYKKIVQTIVYLPHFISWVIIVGITLIFFGPVGVINHVLSGGTGDSIPFMLSNGWFRPMVIFQNIWKDAGWGTIILLAALAGINPELYEAATMDGAGRWRRILHITLPGIRSTIVILLLLRLGHSMESNFLQVFLMSNNLNIGVSDVFDLYVYRMGLLGGDYSFATAAGLFKSVVSLTLVIAANRVAKAFGEDGIF